MRTPIILMLLSLGSSSLTIEAQVEILYSQDFENGLGNMISIDNDGLIMADALAEQLNIPVSPSQWTALEVSDNNTVAISPSWFNPVGIADDWLITPLIDIRPGTLMEWEAFASNPSFRDGYEVLVSTSGTGIEEFEPIFQVAEEFDSPTFRIIDLSVYAGQSIHLAFHNNSNNKQALNLDNIVVRTSNPTDVRVTRLSLSETTFLEAGFNTDAGLPGTKQVLVELVNVGTDLISEFAYTIDAMGSRLMESHVVEILPGQSMLIRSDAFLEFGVGERQEYSISDLTANGISFSEPLESVVSIFPSVPNYDVVGSKGELVNVHDLLAQNKTIVLDFFASWCTPCEVTTPILNAWYETNGSGAGDLEVIGIDIEPMDDDQVVNSLGWGATYPKVAFTPENELYRLHFNDIHGLNSGQLPYFVMICPNPENVADSEVVSVQIGIPLSQGFDFWQPELDACIDGVSSADDLRNNAEIDIFPNPSTGELTLQISELQDAISHISILSAEGQEIKSFTIHPPAVKQVDLNDLDAGVYLLRVSSRVGYEIKKIIIH